MADFYEMALTSFTGLLSKQDKEVSKNSGWKDKQLTGSNETGYIDTYGGENLKDYTDKNVINKGSINIWEDRLKYILQNISVNVVRGEVFALPINTNFNEKEANVINGWKCVECGKSYIDETHLEGFLSKKYLPLIIIDLIKNDQLFQLNDINKLIISDIIVSARNRIRHTIKQSGASLTEGKKWMWMCSTCNCRNISAYRWSVNKNETGLADSKDNLRIIGSNSNKLMNISKVFTF